VSKSRIILGVDPGTTVLGYGIVRVEGNTLSMITAGVIHLNKLEDHYQKLHRIYEKLDILIKEYKPDEFAVESPFFGKNVQSMLKLGRAQGIAIVCAMNNGLKVFEYAPKKIKQSITGSGNASKEQVAAMLTTLLHSKEIPTVLDATDALGAAVCHYFQKGVGTLSLGGKKTNKKGWGSFVKENKDRVS